MPKGCETVLRRAECGTKSTRRCWVPMAVYRSKEKMAVFREAMRPSYYDPERSDSDLE